MTEILFHKSCEELHRYSDDHILIKITIGDLLSLPIDNWEYNRPADMIRCREIARYICRKRSEMDWLLYIFLDGERFKVVDGIHRLNALRMIRMEDERKDLISGMEFGEVGWVWGKYVLVSLRRNCTLGDLVDLFQSLNKSNPVPDLYLEGSVGYKRDLIERVVVEWQGRYGSHFSGTVRPQVPNINRDRFIEILDMIYEKCGINKGNGHLLGEKLEEMNMRVKNGQIKCSMKAREKCEMTGCYLFLLKKEQMEEML